MGIPGWLPLASIETSWSEVHWSQSHTPLPQAQHLTEIRYVLLLRDGSVLQKIEMGSEWIWATRRVPAASDEVQEVCGSTGNDY